jgi:methyltransferase OMS1, mitochondrial
MAALHFSILNPAIVYGNGSLAQAPAPKKSYDDYADGYDLLDGRESGLASALGFPRLRAETISRAFGQVLEVACGTGANFPLYAQLGRGVTSLTGLDVSSGMLARARKVGDEVRLMTPNTGQPFCINLVQGEVTSLPFNDESFDTVVDTFSLCVFEDPGSALCEMRRVLRRSPEARMLLLEHSVSSFGPLALYQDVTAPVVASVSKGCFWNQDVVKLIDKAGLQILSQEEHLAGTTRLFELRRNDVS